MQTHSIAKINRVEIANKNLSICRKGKYKVSCFKLGKQCSISLADTLVNMMGSNITIEPEECSKYLSYKMVDTKLNSHDVNCKVEVLNESVVDVILRESKYAKVGVLNFASARNAGGGYLYGSLAQEEALCYSSALYMALEGNKFYDINKLSDTGVYTDAMIYTSGVPFFRDSSYNLLSSFVTVDVLTSPAVNLRVLKSNKGYDKIDSIMYNRMRNIICEFSNHNIDTLVLGAFGCGVFGNDPKKIANNWWGILMDEGFINKFKKIIFAVYGNVDNLKAFEEVWGGFNE